MAIAQSRHEVDSPAVTTLDLVLKPKPGKFRRVMRIFISSTFTDMQEERDELVLRVLPELRQLCGSRGVVSGEVDLRWGISSEQRAEGQVLPICLEEIRNCRPFFIGFLGERYGWDNPVIPEELLEREPWLTLLRDRSITEIEMLYGALDAAPGEKHAYFYLRDEAYAAAIPEDRRAEFIEGPRPDEMVSLGIHEAERRAAGRQQKLSHLKERVRRSGCAVRDYHEPREFGQLVKEDLFALVDHLFPKEEGPRDRSTEREAALHDAAAWSLAEVAVGDGARQGAYVGRDEYGKRLDVQMKEDGLPLVITGESGSGKSALLANWLLRYRLAHPEVTAVFHVVGASPRSANASALLARLVDEVGSGFGGSYSGNDAEGQSATLQVFLGIASRRSAAGLILLVLDGLDKLDNRHDLDLDWLPEIFPKGVRVIVSAGPGRAQTALKRRGWPVLPIAPLDRNERDQVIRRYLSGFRKTLESELVGRLINCEATSNPLYLRAVLDEIRFLGQSDSLDAILTDYLGTASMSDLFGRILSRFEHDYERDRPGLIRDAMSLLWAARSGLSDSELLDLLGADGNPLPAAAWSPIRCALGSSLSDRSGLLGFAHTALADAVAARYLSEAELQKRAHAILADYFAKFEGQSRSIEELPWQLEHSAQWQRLKDVLSKPDYLAGMGLSDEAALRRMWAEIEQHTGIASKDAVRPLLGKRSTLGLGALLTIESLGWSSGDIESARESIEEVIQHLESYGDSRALAALLKNSADIHERLGHKQQARDLLERGRGISERLGDQDGTASSLLSETALWMAEHDYARALGCSQRAAEISRRTGNRHNLRVALTNCAGILTPLGRVDEAKMIHVEEEAIAREMEDWEGLAKSFNNQGSLEARYGDAKKALAFFTEAERLTTRWGLARSQVIAIAGQAHAYSRLKDWDRAFEACQRARRWSEELRDSALVTHCVMLQAALFPNFSESQQSGILDEILRHPDLAAGLRVALEGQAEIRKERRSNRESNAITRALRRLDGGEQKPSGKQAQQLIAHGNDLLRQNCLKEAREAFEKAEKIAEQSGANAEELAAASDLAGVLKRMGKLDEALVKIREVSTTAARLRNDEVEQLALSNQATLLWEMSVQSPDRERLEEAWKLSERARKICERRGWKSQHAFVLGTGGLIARFLGRWEDARRCFEQQVEVARECGDADQLGRALLNSIIFTIESKDFGKIAGLVDVARSIIDEMRDPQMRARLDEILAGLLPRQHGR